MLLSDRPVFRLAIWAVLLVLGSAAVTAATAAFRPVDLTCEYRVNPQGMGERAPRLGWRLQAKDPAARALAQTAWQVLVAASPETLAADQGDRWDSGKVAGAATSAIVYRGQPLASRAACWWKVRVWDQSGSVSAWSEPVSWTMGLLEPNEFTAEWIGLDFPTPTDGSTLSDEQKAALKSIPWVRLGGEPSKTSPLSAAVLGKFTLPADKPLAQAQLILLADMRCRVSVNGRPITEITRWDRAVPHPIASALHAGENVVGLFIAQDDGYPPAVRAVIALAWTDGTKRTVPVDVSWRSTREPPVGWERGLIATESWQPLVPLVSAKDPTDFDRSPWGTADNGHHWLAPAPLLRTTFKVAKAVKRATVYVTALGLYELRLNGARVGQDQLAPGWTEFHKRVHYQTYDVTAQIKRGPNALGAILGDGWFAGIASYSGKRRYYGGPPRLRAQLEVEYTDGSKEVVTTNDRWRGAAGAIRYADIYLGSAIDHRLEQVGWDQAKFRDDAWQPVATGLTPESPKDLLVEAATIDPLRVMDELPARRVSEPRHGAYVVDFGQNLVGWVRLKVKGRAGQKITIRHGEILNPNGTIYTSNLRGATATDVYWLRGGKEEVLVPWGTFHGFRYAEITGLDRAPKPEAATGLVIHHPLRRTGEFSCSSPLVNQLFHNIIWGQKGNYVEVPTDCPQRDERLGWTGDTQFFIRTGLFNYEAASFIERWLVTGIEDSQGADGSFPSMVPTIDHKAEANTAWGDAMIVCTHALWLVYGDPRPIERHFDRLARYVELLQSKAKENIVMIGGYGDWLNKGGGAKKEVMDTAYYAHLCGLMSEMAAAIGRTGEATRYAAMREEIATAWQRAFLQPDGKILESSQTGFALAFTMGLLPDEMKARVADQFVADIAAKDWHLATGFIGTPRLLPALHLAGRDDVAYRLLLQETYPSWLLQVKLGATTVWERWDGWTPEQGFQAISMNSFNHYGFGAVGEYLYRHVAGIDTDGPGFRKILIAPSTGARSVEPPSWMQEGGRFGHGPGPGPGLTSARASYDAITGRIESAWRTENGHFFLEITVPPNTTATVIVPTSEIASVREGGKPVAQAAGVQIVEQKANEPRVVPPGQLTLLVGSGHYRFEAKL